MGIAEICNLGLQATAKLTACPENEGEEHSFAKENGSWEAYSKQKVHWSELGVHVSWLLCGSVVTVSRWLS